MTPSTPHPTRASFNSTSTLCLRVRIFDALSDEVYAFLTPSNRHPTRGVLQFDVDFLLKGTIFEGTFVLRVRFFNAFWCPRCTAGSQPADQLASWPTSMCHPVGWAGNVLESVLPVGCREAYILHPRGRDLLRGSDTAIPLLADARALPPALGAATRFR